MIHCHAYIEYWLNIKDFLFWQLQKSLESKILLKPKRLTPIKAAEMWIGYGLDQDGLEKRYIDERIGESKIYND